MREKTCCFRGHRPEKLPPEHSYEGRKIKTALYGKIERAVDNGYDHFIYGGCRGIDLWAAERIVKLKEYLPLRLELAIPYRDHTDRWNILDKQRYYDIFSQVNIISTFGKYFPGSCQVRNEYMIDKSSLLIAVWNGSPSRTKNRIDYAKSKGVEIDILEI